MPRNLADGESCEMQGSAAKPYTLTNTGGVYSCTCPAWRNQSAPIDDRTCKHLRQLRGDAAEKARLGRDVDTKVTRKGSAKKGSAKKVKKGSAKKGSASKTSASTVKGILLANVYDPDETNPRGWWMSEKLDGVRAYWNGQQFISRQGNVYFAPEWFTQDLPDMALDGELWMGRGLFQKTVSIVRRQNGGKQWEDITFMIFDAPEHPGTFEQRQAVLQKVASNLDYAQVVENYKCDGHEHLQEFLEAVEEVEGEGVMIRQPRSLYQAGRSSTLLKVKSAFDTEAVVIGHTKGRGRHRGRMGALELRMADGTEFSVGTGFSDAERQHPPSIGTIVTFRYLGLTDGGKPRCPSYLRPYPDQNAKARKALGL